MLTLLCAYLTSKPSKNIIKKYYEKKYLIPKIDFSESTKEIPFKKDFVMGNLERVSVFFSKV